MIARVAAALVLAIASAVALDRGVIEPLRCSHAASKASVLLDSLSEATDMRRRAVAARVLDRLQDCEQISPPDVTIPFAQAVAEEMSENEQAAIAAYQRALQIDRRPEIYFRLGVVQLAALDRNGGIESLTRACTFDPRLLGEIPYEDVRREVQERIRARYGADW